MSNTSAPANKSGSTGFVSGDLLLKYYNYQSPITSGRTNSGVRVVNGSQDLANAVYALGAMVSDTASLMQLQAGTALAFGKADYLSTMKQIGSYADLVARPVAVLGGVADGVASGISAYQQPRMTLGGP